MEKDRGTNFNTVLAIMLLTRFLYFLFLAYSANMYVEPQCIYLRALLVLVDHVHTKFCFQKQTSLISTTITNNLRYANEN